jgi:hypothetical protein
MRPAKVVVRWPFVFVFDQDVDVYRHEIISKTLHPSEVAVELEGPLHLFLGEAASFEDTRGRNAGVRHGGSGKELILLSLAASIQYSASSQAMPEGRAVPGHPLESRPAPGQSSKILASRL